MSELKSVSELARAFDLDRATVAKRLADAAFQRGPRNAKLYAVDEVTSLLTAPDDSPELEQAKLRRAIADAKKAELIVAKLEGELVNRVAVITEVQEIFAALYQTVCIQYPRRNSGRLSKLKAADLGKKLETDLRAIFDEIADEHSIGESVSGGDTPQ